MPFAEDHRTRDLGTMVLVLRPDLVFTPRYIGGEPSYIVEDRANSKYFNIGIPEYTFVSCFDGKTTVATALSLTAQTIPSGGLSEHDAATVCRWLIENELAFTVESASTERLAAASKEHARSKRTTWNPLYVKVPFVYPDRWITKLCPWVSWLYSKPLAVLTSVLAVIAAYQVWWNGNEFISASAGVFSPGRWLWLGLIWVLLKFVHEVSHAVVCKRYGGTVHEAGLVFILLAPMAYVDVTSSWQFKSKWQRIYVAAAGMYVELLIAALSAIVWTATDPGRTNDLCFNIMLMAGVTTVAFNANPLMRFDGYYMLADLLDVPNLYTDGQLFLRNAGRRYFFGVLSRVSTNSRSRDTFIRLYGIAAFLWRQMVTFGLVIIAATMFEGAGVIIALAAVFLWLVVPSAKLLAFLVRGNEREQPNRVRFACVAIPVVLLTLFAVNTLPWPGVTRAPAIVDYAPMSVVRSGCSGFIEQIHVSDGELVSAGQLIATLKNDELRAELYDLELAMEQSQLRTRVFRQRDELASAQAEQMELESLKKKHKEKAAEVESLMVVAPHAGRINVRNSDALVGTYVTPGTEIVSVGEESKKELHVAIPQEDVPDFLDHVGHIVHARLPGGPRLHGNLVRLPPRASLEPSHLSLTAPYGGPLEVRKKLDHEASDDRDDYELLQPRFVGIVPLSIQASTKFRVGQRGVVWLDDSHETLASRLWRILQDQIPEN